MGLNKALRGLSVWIWVLILCALATQAVAGGLEPLPGIADLWAAAAALGFMLLSAAPSHRR